MAKDPRAEGLAHHKAGRFEAAARSYEAALRRDPRDADVLQLLGLVRHKLGDSEAGLVAIDAALALDPAHGPAWANRATVLWALGRDPVPAHRRAAALGVASSRLELARRWLDDDPVAALAILDADLPDEAHRLRAVGRQACGDGEGAAAGWGAWIAGHGDDVAARIAQVRAWLSAGQAEVALQAARRLGPDGVVALADALAALGRDREAEAALRDGLTRAADRRGVAMALAARLRGSGRAAEALAVLRELDGPDVALELGFAWAALGKAAAAEAAWASVTGPLSAAAAHARGQAKLAAGDPSGIGDLADAAVAGPRWAVISFVDAAGGAAAWPATVAPALRRALDTARVWHQPLDRPVRAVLDATPGASTLTPSTGEPLDAAALDALAGHPLFAPWLERVIVQHPGWEDRLVAIRARIAGRLAAGTASDADRRAAVALALQGWHTEYAWASGPADEAAIAGLPGPDGALARLMFGPDPAAVAADRDRWPQLAAAMVDEPAQELALLDTIAVLGLGDDATSAVVRAMYEEHPYPRLVGLHDKPAEALHRVVARLLPTVRLPAVAAPRVLIAGCGTGQQPISAARRYVGAKVLGVDLSRRSLAAAARRARAWGVANLRLAQADLLALPEALGDARFDLVESGGVLHHLADPVAGWRGLTGLTAVGGLQKIALYTERGRAAVVAARAFAAGTPPDGLRDLRARLRALPDDHPAAPVRWAPDFYSLSGLRDLVLHPMEHRFHPADLAAIVDDLGLEVLGLQHPRPEPAAWYAEAFPGDAAQADLRRWDAVEQAHPQVFAGMIQLWLRRRG